MISIFAKRAFLNTNPSNEFISKEKSYKGHGHLQRVSSMIRGDQIADYLGAKLNPESGYEKDVCIYVKPHVQGNRDFEFKGKRSYLDIVDGWGLVPLLWKHPEVSVIACSRQDYEVLTKVVKNKIVLIPQHHCNFERVKRTIKEIRTVGVIGTDAAFAYLPKGLKEELAKRGIALLTYSKFFSREDIVSFYSQIEVQMVWRPYRMRLSNPLKLANASSFGIPTIALEERVFEELAGCYIPVKTFEDFLEVLDSLRTSPKIYANYSKNCLVKAEEYHIKNIAKLYKKL